jgi:DnaK suppressor protein
MSAKKPSKPVRKPAKAPAKKAVAKSAAARKAARPVNKAPAKAITSRVVAKATKPAAKAPAPKTPLKTGAAKPVAAIPMAARQANAKVAAGAATTAPAFKGPPAGKTIAPVRTGAIDEDADTDAASPASLLAGPRNVKPYIPRRGEQYMNKEQLGHFARILHHWKRDLMVEVDRTVLHMKDEAANFPDPNDRATQEEEFSLELRTRDRERKLIRKIDEALKRIDDGNYGYCLETGEEIGIKRLEARPVATLSVEAQERRERREKQYGDRDDRYR